MSRPDERPPIGAVMEQARQAGLAVPFFNAPYLPMLAPLARALRDTATFGMLGVARLDWVKFEARSLAAIRGAYEQVADSRYSSLHLDHVPVIDEDGQRVEFLPIIDEALALGFESVMVDGSRLPLAENIACTRAVVERAHARGVSVEAELGAVLGHEADRPPPYEELFASGRGFTSPDEARQLVMHAACDWLSVAVGNVHGAIAVANRADRKVEARLHIGRVRELRAATGVPLVLHGGSGIAPRCLQDAVRAGIVKINIGTATRQPWEANAKTSPAVAQDAVYRAAVRCLKDELGVTGSARRLGTDGLGPAGSPPR